MNGVLEVERAGASSQLAPGQKKKRRAIVAPAGIPAKPKRLTDEQSYLAGEHWDWAMSVARKRAKRYELYDHFVHLEWESAAAFGLCDAALNFEAERGIAFRTYAYRRILGAITDMMRGEALRGYRRGHYEGAPVIQSLAMVVADDPEGRSMTLAMILPEETEPIGFELSSDENFEKAIRCLPPTHREIFRGYFRYDRTMKEIGSTLGMSESRVSQIVTASLELLRASTLPREALSA